MAQRVVAERLEELVGLKTKVDASLEEAELLSLTGAAIGERYPKLLEAKEIIDKSIPALETVLKETEITKLVAAESEDPQAVSNIRQSVIDQVEKQMNEILPESSLSYLRSLESQGVIGSPESSARHAGPEADLDEDEVSSKAQAAAQAFERVYGTSAHPSHGAYGMVPNEATREVWGSIPVGGQQ